MARKKGDLEHDTSSNSAPAGALIRSILERVERMNEEKKAITDDIKEIYAEAKGNGLNTKILRKMVQRRAMDKADRDEQDALLHLYSKAVGDSSPADAEDDGDE